MLRFIAITAALTLGSVAATATTLQLPPKGKPVATVTIPDNWPHEIHEDNYEVESPDESISIEVGTAERLRTEADLAKDVPNEANGIEVVPGSMKSGNDRVNGMKAVVTHLDLKDKKGQKIGVTVTQIVTPKPDVFIFVKLLNFPGSQAHAAELNTMFSSLKMVAAAAAPATAVTVQVPRTGKPMATVTLPDGWSQKDGEEGSVALEPNDGSIHVIFNFEPKPKPLDEDMKEFAKSAGADMQIVGPPKTGKSIVNRRTTTVMQLKLKVKDVASTLDATVTQIPTKSGGNVEVVVVSIPENLKEHAAEVEAIFDSLKIGD